MSPTSTEGGRRFRRALAFTVATLVLLCLAFLGLGYLQGPKLSSAQVDTGAVITQSNEQLRLFANQAVAHVGAKQVTITPAVPFTVSTSGEVIAVQFGARLRYATDYTVTVAGITSVYLAQPSTLSYSFTTDAPKLYYLDRGTPNDDIVSTGLSGPERDVVYSAPHIQDFVPLSRSLAVVTLADDHTSSIDLVNVAEDVVQRLPLPDRGSIEDLGASSTGTMLGFTLTSAAAGLGQANDSTLYTVDFDTGIVAKPVLGLDGQELHVLDWHFIPGTSTLLALNVDRSLLLVDPKTGSVLPLGQFNELGKISQDGAVVTMYDTRGYLALTLADGTQTRLKASSIDGNSPFLGATETLANSARIQKVVVPDATGTRFASLLVYDDGTTARVLYQTPNGAGSISDFTVSPNGQYVAVETVPDNSASVSDGYFYDARSTSVTTVIVDVDSGAQVRSFEGFALAW